MARIKKQVQGISLATPEAFKESQGNTENTHMHINLTA